MDHDGVMVDHDVVGGGVLLREKFFIIVIVFIIVKSSLHHVDVHFQRTKGGSREKDRCGF